MSELLLIEQLDQAIEDVLAAASEGISNVDPALAQFVQVITDLKHLPQPNFEKKLRTLIEREATMATGTKTRKIDQSKAKTRAPMRAGYRTVTPYLTVPDIHAEIEFIKKAFGATGRLYGLGSAGGFHSEYKIGDSMLMIGGGGKGAAWKGTPQPSALHLYVDDVDAIYDRALQAGASSLMAPTDQSYGDRDAAVEDVGGNHWYIATHKGASYVPEAVDNLMAYLHPVGAPKLITFLKDAFAAEEIDVYRSPDGVVRHGKMRIGSSIIELGEAHEQWKPMPMSFMLYVDDCDAWYERAIKATGAIVESPPAGAPYGGRTAVIKDAFENTWYISTP